MTTIPKVVLAGLSLVLASFSTCQQTKPTGGNPVPPQLSNTTCQQDGKKGTDPNRSFCIHIYQDPDDSSKCFADFPAATLWARDTHTVTWISDDTQYTIDFGSGSAGSPFDNGNSFTMTQSSAGTPFQVQSPKVKKNPPGPKSVYYNYFIKVGSNTGHTCNADKDNDPGIYVK